MGGDCALIPCIVAAIFAGAVFELTMHSISLCAVFRKFPAVSVLRLSRCYHCVGMSDVSNRHLSVLNSRIYCRQENTEQGFVFLPPTTLLLRRRSDLPNTVTLVGLVLL